MNSHKAIHIVDNIPKTHPLNLSIKKVNSEKTNNASKDRIRTIPMIINTILTLSDRTFENLISQWV